jgi:serine/threonine protein kinase/tetratricopeptide (TPR) repeat protein
MGMIIGRSLTLLNSSGTMRVVRRCEPDRPRDDNSRGKGQNVRGDSSAIIRTTLKRMACPHCGSTAPALHGRCAGCGGAPFDADTQTLATEITTSGAPSLRVGQNFGSRYRVLRLLGIGGMGAVYQAWDQTLEVAVALKVIRPEATPVRAAAQHLEERFKRELLLARRITHKNVIRIHDLGQIDGVTFITMPYVQGSDLATILKRDGRLPVARALKIVREVASGLAAAHDVGVVHRDLKPANIMVGAESEALIMDFGIARSTAAPAGLDMTAPGAILGTVTYMAPEQARGDAVDQRADIYSFGLILNDLLLGRRQGGSPTAVAELMARMHHAPLSVRSIDPTIPAAIDALVTRCLQPDPAFRYQRMTDLIAEIERLDHDGHPTLAPSTVPAPSRLQERPPAPSPVVTRWIAVACLLSALTAGGFVLRNRFLSARLPLRVAGLPTISLAILPFRNASGDPTLDLLGSSLSDVLRTEIGQSVRLRIVPSDRVHQVLQDLHIAPNATLAPTERARVEAFTNARRVLWGQFLRFGNAIRIEATLQELDHEQTASLNAMAPNSGTLLTAVSQLAEALRQNLSHGSPGLLNELKSTSWKPSTNSFDALERYEEGRELTRQGKPQAALKSFEAATKSDSNFALAFSGLALSYATLSYDTEALQFSRRAMSLSDTLPPQEKYRISANHYRIIVGDTNQALASYENLVKASPNDATLQFDLGALYEQSLSFEQARQHFVKVVELDPKFANGLLALGRVEIKSGNPQGSLDHLNGALTLAIQLDNDALFANCLQAIGVAYKLLNRLDEALRRYRESFEIKRGVGSKPGMVASLHEIARVQQQLGKPRDAEKSYRQALGLQREIGDKLGISFILVDFAALLSETLGRPDDALPLLHEALQLQRDTGNENGQALVLNNIGSLYLTKGRYSEAQTYFERELQLREKAKVPGEVANTLRNLAETLAKMGRYDQSLARCLRALGLRRGAGDKRGTAIESYNAGTILAYQGHYGAAVKSMDEALQGYRDLKQRDTWLAQMLDGYGNSLSLSGRLEEAGESLGEALALARELHNQNLIAQTLRLQMDRLYYSGDVKGANDLAEQAVQAASSASDRSLTLLAEADVTTTAAVVQPSKALASKLATLARDADKLGLKWLSVDCSIQRAATLLKLGDRANARQEADRALTMSEALGLSVQRAKARYLRAEVLRLGGDAARDEYSAALRLLEQIKGEDGNKNVLKRSDLGAMQAECVRWSTGVCPPESRFGSRVSTCRPVT